MRRLTTALGIRLVRLYPARWRARYDEELRDVLARRPPTWADVGDLTRHLLYTHLHPDLALTGDESPLDRLALLVRTLRSSETVVFCAFVVAALVWLQFGGLVDGGPYAPLVAGGDSWPVVHFAPGNGLSLAMAVLLAAVDLAFVAVLVGGVPLAVAAFRRSPRVRGLFLVPLASLVGAILPAPLALLVLGRVPTFNLTFESPVTIAYLCWFAALAALGTWALVRAITTDEAEDRMVRFAFVPSAVAAGALVLMVVALIAWGIVAHLEAPRLFDRGELVTGHATLATWALDVVVMAAAALVAVLAAMRGAPARTATPASAGGTAAAGAE
jgi:hypothetical protein